MRQERRGGAGSRSARLVRDWLATPRGSNLFHAMAVPEASGAAEGGEAAFGGDAGTGENEEAVLGGELHDDSL